MSSDEEEFRRLAVELRVLEATSESLQSRINFIDAALNELNLAHKTLEAVGKEKADVSLFVPIGGGSYVKAKLESIDQIVYGIGAGVAMEKTIEASREGISNRISELTKTKVSLEQQLSQVLEKAQEDQNRVNELASKFERKVGAPNV